MLPFPDGNELMEFVRNAFGRGSGTRYPGLVCLGLIIVTLSVYMLSSLLLLFLLLRITGSLWQSPFVAALFALHPLHVGPVAYLLSLITFVLGMMCNPSKRHRHHPGGNSAHCGALLFHCRNRVFHIGCMGRSESDKRLAMPGGHALELAPLHKMDAK